MAVSVTVAAVSSIDNCLLKCCTVCFDVIGRSYRSLITESSSVYREYIDELGVEFAGYLCHNCTNRINRLQKLDHEIKTKVDRLKAKRNIIINELNQLVNARRQCAPGLPFVPDRGKQKVRKKSIQVDEKKIAEFKKGLKRILPAPSPVIIINDGRYKPKPEDSNPNGRVADDKKRKIEIGVNVIPVKQVKTTPDAVAAEPASSEEPPPNKPVLLVRNYNAVTSNSPSLLLPNGTIQSDVGLAGIAATDVTSSGYTGIKQPQGQENKAHESGSPSNGQSADKHVLTFSGHESCGKNKLLAEEITHSSNDSSCVTSVNDPANPPKLYKLVMANPTDGSNIAMYGCAVRLEEVAQQHDQTYSQKSSFANVSAMSDSNMAVRNPESVQDYMTSGNVPNLSQLLQKNNTSENIIPKQEYSNLSAECYHNSDGLSVQLTAASTSVPSIKSGSSLEQAITQDKSTDMVNIKDGQEDEEYNSECQKTQPSNQVSDSNYSSLCERSHSPLHCTDYFNEVNVKQEQSEEYNSQSSDQVVDSDMSLHCEKSDASSKETDYSDMVSVKQEHNAEYNSQCQSSHQVSDSDLSSHSVKSDSSIPATDDSNKMNVKQEEDKETDGTIKQECEEQNPNPERYPQGRSSTSDTIWTMKNCATLQLLRGISKYASAVISETKNGGSGRDKCISQISACQKSQSAPPVPESDPPLHIVKFDSSITGIDGSNQVNIKQEPDAEFSSQGDKLQSLIPDQDNTAISLHWDISQTKHTVTEYSQSEKSKSRQRTYYVNVVSQLDDFNQVEKQCNFNTNDELKSSDMLSPSGTQPESSSSQDELKVQASPKIPRHTRDTDVTIKEKCDEKKTCPPSLSDSVTLSTCKTTQTSSISGRKMKCFSSSQLLKGICKYASTGSSETKHEGVEIGKKSNKQTSNCTGNTGMDEPGTSRVKIGADLKQCRHALSGSSETKHEGIEKEMNSNRQTSECTGNTDMDEAGTSRVKIGTNLKQCLSAYLSKKR